MRPPQRRWPFAPLQRLTGWTADEWAEHVGVSERTIDRWRVQGVPENWTDQLAVSLGTHPANVWPEWLMEAA